MAFALCHRDEPRDLECTIIDFLCDSSRADLKLPPMTSEQRKDVKTLLARYPDLVCESFGFGSDRTLHIFKNGASAKRVPAAVLASDKLGGRLGSGHLPSVGGTCCVKNTFIDDWFVAEMNEVPGESICFRSMPPKLGERNVIRCNDQSTLASSLSVAPSSPRSSATTEAAPSLDNFSDPHGLQVRNTFIHFTTESADDRATRSMPHDMFYQSLLEEASGQRVCKPCGNMLPQGQNVVPVVTCDDDCALSPGTEVTIHGLTKFPAFNGLSAIVELFDDASGRYSVLLPYPVGGHTSAKVKRENLRPVVPFIDQILESYARTLPATPAHHLNAYVPS